MRRVGQPVVFPEAAPRYLGLSAPGVSSWSELARRLLLPGLVSGVAFLAIAMIGGLSSTSMWAMPDAVAAAVGLEVHGYGFQPGPVAIGVMVHLMVSTALGVLYAELARRLGLRRRGLVIGAWLFSGLETPVSIWLILHSVLTPSTFRFFLSAIPFWASFMGRTVYGLVLGSVIAFMQGERSPAGFSRAPRGEERTVTTAHVEPRWDVSTRLPTPARRRYVRFSLVMNLLLLLQFLLGMVVNLYVTIPARHPGAGAADYFAGAMRGIGWVIPNAAIALATHAILGLALIVVSVAHLVAARAVGRGCLALSAIGLLALIGAAFNGISFVNYGHDFSSMIMAGCFALALLCYTFAAAAGQPLRPTGGAADGRST